MIETIQNAVYTTTRYGTPIEKQPIFFTLPEWDALRELAHECATPIGNLIVRLAHAERHRRLDASIQ